MIPFPSPILSTRGLSVFYSGRPAVKNVDIDILPNRVTALIGPSGCGKSTLLRCFNRMNDVVPGARVEGTILFRGNNLNAPGVDQVLIRRHIGMVFQKPTPFPRSISENIRWGLRLHGLPSGPEAVEASLRAVYLWEEVKDKLKGSALALSGGQQQRLCIARAMALEPEILLMDEPCSALDPIATDKIEKLIAELKQRCTVVIVTHNLAQARRISDETIFLYQGQIIESGPSARIFEAPSQARTADYVQGRFG